MAAVRTQIEEHGVSEKTHGKHGLAGSMRRKFERFLEKHAVRLGLDLTAEPTVEIAEHFVEYCASGAGREYFSCCGSTSILLIKGRQVPKSHLGRSRSDENSDESRTADVFARRWRESRSHPRHCTGGGIWNPELVHTSADHSLEL